jgi:hypothetical protein
MHDRPQARSEGIVAEWADDDLVIYDQLSQTAHSLSAAVANVWEVCDGQHSADEIARQLSLEPAMVARALEQLSECALLDDGSAIVPGISRREAAKKFAKIGGVAFTAPLIYSVAIPAAAAAASCVSSGTQPNGTQYTSAQGGCYTTCVGTTSVGSPAFGYNSNYCASGHCYAIGRGISGVYSCVSASETCKESGQPCTSTADCCYPGGSQSCATISCGSGNCCTY